MAFNKPIDDNDCVKYKIANTDRQSCLVCGHPMREGQIGLSVTNAHLEQTKAKKTPSTNLWVHHECMAKFSKELRKEEHEENQRINLKKCTSKKQWCIHCGKKITNSIQIEMNNKNDAITTRKSLWLHKKCAKELGRQLHWKKRNLPN
tara:strand:+ start:478 stop:921 length:444 start_codon:yes stop_codon:yes gene_type:complete